MKYISNLTTIRIFLSSLIILFLIFPFYTIGISFSKYLVNGIPVDSKNIFIGLVFISFIIFNYLDNLNIKKRKKVLNNAKEIDLAIKNILFYSILIAFARSGFVSLLIPIIFIIRDQIVDLIHINDKKKKVEYNISDRLKEITLIIGIILILFYNLPFEFMGIRVDLFFIYFSALMSLVSMVDYYYLIKKNKEIEVLD